MGRIYEDCFWLELEFPVSLYDGLGFLMEVTRVEQRSDEVDANYPCLIKNVLAYNGILFLQVGAQWI